MRKGTVGSIYIDLTDDDFKEMLAKTHNVDTEEVSKLEVFKTDAATLRIRGRIAG